MMVETIPNALQAMGGKASARELAARLKIEPRDALALLREHEERNEVCQVNGHWQLQPVSSTDEIVQTLPCFTERATTMQVPTPRALAQEIRRAKSRVAQLEKLRAAVRVLHCNRGLLNTEKHQ